MKRSVLKSCALVMVFAMMLGLFTSCTSKGNNNQGSQANTSKAQPVELTVEVFDRATPGQTPVDNNYWTKWIQDKFGTPNNIIMKFVPCPRSQEVDKLNVWMASGSAPDISVTYDVNVVYNYVKNNGLADLTDALNQYGPNLKKYLEKTLPYGVYNGKQYAIPAKRVMQARTGTFIRKDWLDKLGMQVPDTTDDFYKVLKAFKEKNPGNVDKVVPFAMTNDVEWCAQGFFQTFQEQMSEEELFVNKYLYLKGHKEAARFLNQMYHEGLISPEFALDKDGKMLDQDVIRGAAGSYTSNYDAALRAVPGHLAGLQKNIPNAQLVPCDPFTNKYTGKHQKEIYDPAGIRIIVPKSSKRVNEVIKYLDWMANKDVIFFLQNGNEGIGHQMVNGLPKVLAPKGEQMFNSPQNIDYTLILNGIDLGTDQQNIQANALSYPGYENLFESAVKLATRDSYVAPSLPVPVDADAKYSKTLKDKEKEIYAKCITCKPAEFDKVWDSLVQEHLKMGGQEVLDQRRAAWKEVHK